MELHKHKNYTYKDNNCSSTDDFRVETGVPGGKPPVLLQTLNIQKKKMVQITKKVSMNIKTDTEQKEKLSKE